MTPLIIDSICTQYQIDEDGNIYNIRTKKYLLGTIRSGYRMVKLTINGKKRDFSVHRLVASTFLPNENNLPQVNHKDGNKLNNSVSNLEWISAAHNINHAIQLGRNKRQIIKPIDEPIDSQHGWKQYKDTFYWVNLDGRCANIKTNKYLNYTINADGYCRYYLYIHDKRVTKLVHRMIFEVFSGKEISPNNQINHIDGNKQNNSYENLEEVCRSENMQHSCYILRKNIRSIIQCDLKGKELAFYPSISQAAKQNNFSDSGIVQACKGKIKTYKGFIWKYKEV